MKGSEIRASASRHEASLLMRVSLRMLDESYKDMSDTRGAGRVANEFVAMRTRLRDTHLFHGIRVSEQGVELIWTWRVHEARISSGCKNKS